MTFYKIAHQLDEFFFSKENLCNILINGKEITLAKYRGQLFAFATKCPHAGAPLSEGYLDDKNCIVCLRHGHRFNILNGRNMTGEDYRLKIYKTKHLEDGWYVEI